MTATPLSLSIVHRNNADPRMAQTRSLLRRELVVRARHSDLVPHVQGRATPRNHGVLRARLLPRVPQRAGDDLLVSGMNDEADGDRNQQANPAADAVGEHILPRGKSFGEKH